jgi:hypothetical protein
MRTPDKTTLIFGSPSPPQPASQRTPASQPLEREWFDEPQPIARPLKDDLLPERPSFISRGPERALAFAAIALLLIGVVGAGSYYYFGLGETAHDENHVGTTTVTNAEIPTAPTTTPPGPSLVPAPAPAVSPADLPWTPPVVDAVKSPRLPREIPSPQLPPVERETSPAPAPSPSAAKTMPRQVPASEQQADDEARAAAGFYPNYTPNPGDNSVTPPPIQRMPPSAGDTEVTTHMTPDQDENTMHNPSGEPALPQTIKQ